MFSTILKQPPRARLSIVGCLSRANQERNHTYCSYFIAGGIWWPPHPNHHACSSKSAQSLVSRIGWCLQWLVLLLLQVPNKKRRHVKHLVLPHNDPLNWGPRHVVINIILNIAVCRRLTDYRDEGTKNFDTILLWQRNAELSCQQSLDHPIPFVMFLCVHAACLVLQSVCIIVRGAHVVDYVTKF